MVWEAVLLVLFIVTPIDTTQVFVALARFCLAAICFIHAAGVNFVVL